MTDRWIYLLLYFEVVFIGMYLILRIFRSRKKSWSKKDIFFSRVFLSICLTTIVVYTAVLAQFFLFSDAQFDQFISSHMWIQFIEMIFLIVLFFLGAVGIMYVGIKSIREKKTLSLGPFPHRWVEGRDAVIEGIKYFIIGTVFLSGVLRIAWMVLFE